MSTAARQFQRTARSITQQIPSVPPLVWVGVAAAAFLVLIVTLPESRRYLKIESM